MQLGALLARAGVAAMTAPTDDEFTAEAAAAELKVGESTARRMLGDAVKAGTLETREARVGGRVRRVWRAVG